uniref:NADH dehydrogenase subunit 6 n=1 Tax=Phyllotreta striolata TaxID=444603 RepID=UPI0013B3A97C|nr:NADH dehydrogenase subunit 6 [Phyllotreta striolata]QHR79691.1 NADH dehydrogenase subunit 6 [Phyllotreta striolata]UPE50061.1 NADH dehydrogenase subunit 6 [Phyllotreta striolata]WDV10362.1 NADH dehydrogenase subunit 6 [Phyllotreta striolata]
MLLFMLLNTMILFFLNHPLSFGLILLIQTIQTCLLSGLLNLNFWYSYILFLVLIGGMLILFIYMTSIASNEKFKFNFIGLIWYITAGIMFNLIPFEMSFNISDFFSFDMNLTFKSSFTKYLSYPNIYIYLIMIIYLFITLILTVKMTKFSYGPLRQKF